MRASLFLLCFFFSAEAISQTCTESDFTSAGGTVSCTTLTVSNPVNIAAVSGALPMEFIVSGDVIINADISISGGDGFTITTDNTFPGGVGTLAGDNGGGIAAATAEPGGLGTVNDGGAGVDNGTCNPGGGGGGGFSSAGEDGSICSGGGTPGTGGTLFGFPSPFRGGFAGGAGGAYPVGPNFDLGSGGGGGGALYIQAGGTITIANGVRITARGGRGGNSSGLGGGGGGGAGGVIWLQTPLPLNNSGIFDVRGGEGGFSTSGSSPKGAAGGKGGDGTVRFEVNGAVTDRSGLINFAQSAGNFKSDISCGTLAKKEAPSTLPQTLLGFFLVAAFASVLKNFSRFQKKL